MMSVRKNRVFASFLVLAAFAALPGCLYQEGTITENRVQVKEERFVQKIPLKEASGEYLAGLAKHYEKHGDGPVALSVTYDPRSRTNTAMHASQEAAHLVRTLRDEGVRNIKADILPVKEQGDGAVMIVSYMSYTAHAPKDCGVMPGINDTDISSDEEYRMGCTLETMFARQVSRPKDLLGQGRVDPTSDGRRASNMGEMYRGGLGNESLEGESASE